MSLKLFTNNRMPAHRIIMTLNGDYCTVYCTVYLTTLLITFVKRVLQTETNWSKLLSRDLKTWLAGHLFSLNNNYLEMTFSYSVRHTFPTNATVHVCYALTCDYASATPYFLIFFFLCQKIDVWLYLVGLPPTMLDGRIMHPQRLYLATETLKTKM